MPDLIEREGPNVAADEPVTSPDQHKPTNPKAARIGGIFTIFALVAMALFGNHNASGGGDVENAWLFTIAGVIAAILIGDWVLRRNGLRS